MSAFLYEIFMKAFVITIKDHEKSEQVADRCIQSAKDYGLDVVKFDAITPKDDILDICNREVIAISRFQGVYSRLENSLSAFLSHYSLWKNCVQQKEPFIIFEHDAVVNSPIPKTLPKYVGNIGKPSYGKFNIPSSGWGRLTSKPYFPGAHAYIVTPEGAQRLIDAAPLHAMTTDVYLSRERFDWLEEHYPWSAEAQDTFTTIQNFTGCLAKHNYDSNYQIENVS